MHKKSESEREKKLAGDANVIIIIYRKTRKTIRWMLSGVEISLRLLKKPFLSDDHFEGPGRNATIYDLYLCRNLDSTSQVLRCVFDEKEKPIC